MGPIDPPRLRGVHKTDLDAIAELEATAFGTNSLARSSLDVFYDPSGPLWLLAEDDEGIWGHSVNARDADPHVGWILGMAVHPERQGRGWGRYLLNATVHRLQDAHIDVIRLLVKSTNKVAYGLYEDVGFIDTGQREQHLGGEDRVVMSLLLAPDGTRELSGTDVPQIPADPDPFAGPDDQGRYV